MASEAVYVCDGPACRLRARDLELVIPEAQRVPCIGRCDAPVAAFSVAREQPRVLLRELTLARRGQDPQPATAPGAQRGPREPMRLRDLLLSDQPALDMARRRGAYRGLESPVELGRLLPGAWPEGARAPVVIVDGGGGQPGQFGLRPICERDPHAVVAGMLIAARSAGATRALFRFRQPWIEARRALEHAVTEAVAAGLAGDVTLAIIDDGSDISPFERHRRSLANDPAASRADTPRADTSLADTPLADTPLADTPLADTPLADTPRADTPLADTPLVDRPGAADTQRADTLAEALVVKAELVVALPHLLARDMSWWAEHALRLCAVSGDVLRPGVYELDSQATVADAIAAAGGVVDGVRTSTLSSFLADGTVRTPAQANAPAPDGLIVAHARRDPFDI